MKVNLESDLFKKKIFIITVDIDWASDYIIKETVDYFLAEGIPITVFNTHHSGYLKSLETHKMIEFNVHPNYVPTSSQGATNEEILDFCKELVPDAIGYRCHRYIASNDVEDLMNKNGFKYDSNICTMLEPIRPFITRYGHLRFPVFFEDGAFVEFNRELDFSKNDNSIFLTKGIKVINVHPIQMILNSKNYKVYREIADNIPRDKWSHLAYNDIEGIVNRGIGIRDYVKSLIAYAKENDVSFMKMRDVYNEITINEAFE